LFSSAWKQYKPFLVGFLLLIALSIVLGFKLRALAAPVLVVNRAQKFVTGLKIAIIFKCCYSFALGKQDKDSIL
jgi:hypothetical protein